jgi:hypothetical protein
MNKKWLLLIIATHIPLSHAYPIVYNMRVRRAFHVPFDIKKKSFTLLSALPIYFGRRSHIVTETPAVDVHENRNVVGSLFNVRYLPSLNWWVELTTGLENDRSSFEGSDSFSASRTGFDDFLFTGGYRHFLGDRTQLIFYGLAGLPAGTTVRKDDRYGPLVGSRFYGAGFGTEASYAFIEEKKQTLSAIIQQRFVHFFSRNWFPVLPACDTIVPGNFTDLLVALQYRRQVTAYEAGVDFTFFTNQGVKTPAAMVSTANFTRYAGYINVLHLIRSTVQEGRKPIVIGGGVNVSGTKVFHAKTYSVWLGVTIVF